MGSPDGGLCCYCHLGHCIIYNDTMSPAPATTLCNTLISPRCLGECPRPGGLSQSPTLAGSTSLRHESRNPSETVACRGRPALMEGAVALISGEQKIKTCQEESGCLTRLSEGWRMHLCQCVGPRTLPDGFYKLSHLMVLLKSLMGRCFPIKFSQVLAPLSQ